MRLAKDCMAKLTSKRHLSGLLLLIIAGFLGNYFRWTLFFDVDFLFGSIAVWIVVCLYGVRWGTLAGFVAGLCTYFLWHHPYTVVTFTIEAFFVGWLFHRRQFHRRQQQNIVLLDAAFWLLVGMPLVWLFYTVFLNVAPAQALIILFKQPVNGIFNALIASLLLTHLPIHRWVARPPAIQTLSLQQTVFNLLVTFVMAPTLILIVLASHQVVNDLKSTVRLDLSDATRYLGVEVSDWYERRLNAISELSRLAMNDAISGEILRENAEFAQRVFPDFRHIHVLDQTGRKILDVDSADNPGETNFDDLIYFRQLQRSPQSFLALAPPQSENTAEPKALLGVPMLQDGRLVGAVLGEIDLNGISTLLQANVGDQSLNITLVDQQDRVAASTEAAWIGRHSFNWRENGTVQPIGDQSYHWLPQSGSALVMVKWYNSRFVKETTISPEIPWTLVVQMAAAPHVRLIQQVHTQNMAILLLISGFAPLAATWVSRQLVKPVSQLAVVTTNLPHKLLEQESIHWTQSQITEFALLIKNFRLMASSLQQKFREIQQVNETLEQRVQERTQALQLSNTALRESETRFRQMAERERLLGAIALQMRQSLELDDILNTTVAEVRQFLQTDRVIIYQFQPDWSGTIIVESVVEGYQSIWGRKITDTYFVETQGEQYKKGRILATADIYTADLEPCHVELLKQLQVRANLVVPILQGDMLWGLLVAQHCHAPRNWQDSEIDFLKQLATQAAIAIQQSELYQHEQQLNSILEHQVEDRTAQLQQALRYEAMIQRIADKVRESLDEDQILQTAVEELGRGLEVYACNTALFDVEQDTMTISYAYNQAAVNAQLAGVLTHHFVDIYPQVLAGQSLQFCQLPTQAVDETGSALAILACPIIDDQGVLGKLRLFRDCDAMFSEPEIRLVSQVANQCAIAIRQARLYQAAQVEVKALEELNQLKDDFLSTVSHELRTPISNMRMAIHMLKTLPTAERRDRYMEILQTECTREAELINDLLDLQRLASGTRMLEPEAIDLQNWLDELIGPFQERTQNRQQTLQLKLSPDLSSWTSDRACLSRILAELLNNACKYTPPGETIELSVQLINPLETATLRLSVRNSGVEIPESERLRIFEKFYRIPGVDRWRQGGTGLGLALVQKLTDHIGGTIQVESHSNSTCFVVELKSNEPLENRSYCVSQVK